MPSQYNLTILKEGQENTPHVIKEGETIEVGRKQRKDDDNPGQMKLDSKVVSRKHAEFRVENGKVQQLLILVVASRLGKFFGYLFEWRTNLSNF